MNADDVLIEITRKKKQVPNLGTHILADLASFGCFKFMAAQRAET